MKIEDIKILHGENKHQNATIEINDKMIDYEASTELSYIDILSISNLNKQIKDILEIVINSKTRISLFILV